MNMDYVLVYRVPRKKKIGWLRIAVLVNLIVTSYISWCIFDLYRLCDSTSSAMVFMSKILTIVFGVASRVHL